MYYVGILQKQLETNEKKNKQKTKALCTIRFLQIQIALQSIFINDYEVWLDPLIQTCVFNDNNSTRHQTVHI